MRTLRRRRQREAQLYGGLLLLAAALLLGLLQLWGWPSGPHDAAPGSSTSDGSASPPPGPIPPLQPTITAFDPTIVSFGGSGEQLAVVVRNESQRVIRRAGVVITARGLDGEILARRSDGPRSTCCTVLGLPPGGEFGLFLDIDMPVSAVAAVEVSYTSVSLGNAPSSVPTVKVASSALRRTSGDTVVDARLVVEGPRRLFGLYDGYLVGQAFLTDEAGELVGVISGRFYCFSAATRERDVTMQLLRKVPPGTRIGKVVAYAVPTSAGLAVPYSCSANREGLTS